MHEFFQTLNDVWYHLTQTTLFGLLLTLACYQLGYIIYDRCGRPILLHPVASASIVIALLIRGWLPISYTDYRNSNEFIYFLLGPATVAMALPLYQQFHHIRKMALPILVTVILGASVAAGSAILIAWLLGGSETTVLSVAPKSVTTPIAITISQSIGGLTTLTTGVVVFTGIIGSLMSPLIFSLLQIHDPRTQGIVLGINAHGLGTARGFELNPTTGALASVAMGLTGAFTALTLPYAIVLFRSF